MSSSQVLVVGASRGIGLALVEELLKRDSTSTVFATVRDVPKATELGKLATAHPTRLVILQLDMVDEPSIKDTLSKLSSKTTTLTTVIVNGAIARDPVAIESLSSENLLMHLSTNVVGPHNVIRAFSPLLLASTDQQRTLAIVSSVGGSIQLLPMVAGFMKTAFKVDHLISTAYQTSKSAVNMLGRQWADSLEPKGVATVLIHPGNVKTDMNPGEEGMISTEESAKGVLDQLEKLDIASTGKGILSYDGEVYAW